MGSDWFFHMYVNFGIPKQYYFVNTWGKYIEGKIFPNHNRFVKIILWKKPTMQYKYTNKNLIIDDLSVKTFCW